LLSGPSLDLRPKPELHTPLAEVEHGPRHVAVPLLVLEHGVAVGEAKDLGDTLRVDQVVGIDASHDTSLHRYADPSDGLDSVTM
jgi:hypothetical protein